MFRHGIHFCYICAITTLLYVTSSNYGNGKSGNLRVHNSVSRIGLIRSDYYTTSIFGSVGWGFAPDPIGELTALPQTQWSNCGRTRGTAFPLIPFLAGERRSPSLHDDSYLQHKQQKKCVLNASFKVTPIVNRVTLNHAFCNL